MSAKTVSDSFEIIVIRFARRFAYYNIRIILHSVPRALIPQIYYVYVNGLLDLINVPIVIFMAFYNYSSYIIIFCNTMVCSSYIIMNARFLDSS